MQRILIIDEHPFICSLLSRTLQGNDIVVAPYETIEKALPYLKDYCCDLCFLELKLSEEDALRDMKMLKGIAPGMKVIAMSGSHVSDRMIGELENNGCLLMRKPFLPSEIRSMTSDALGAVESFLKEYSTDGSQQKRERRMSERTPISRRIVYCVNGQGVEDNGRKGDVLNISESGMLMLTAFPVSTGDRLRFSFGIDESKGAVAWSRKNQNNTYSAGICFI